jgi:phage terminase large subunit-like protein
MSQQILKDYITAVEKKKIPAGIHLRNAIKRFKADLKRKDIYYDQEKVDRVVSFISNLKHYTGSHAGKPFVLEPWQVFIIANLYGFYNKNGLRRFQTAYIEIGRKNGKTALVAALALYHLVGDNEGGAEILFTANSKDQAKIAFNCVKAFTSGFDPKEKYLRRFRADILFQATNSFIKVLASDSDKLDGYNCSLGIVDEYHSAPDSRVRDVVRSSMGMRSQPMLITITTAGFDKSLPCWELRLVATEIIAGLKKDDSFFSVIYCIDDDDDWKDSRCWVKANPNMNITISEEFIKTQVNQAINNPADEVGVKTKNLNVWCDTADVWIPDDFIISASKPISTEFYDKKDTFLGVDLSSNTDLTAVTYLTVEDDIYYFKTYFYVPIDSISTRPDKEMYKTWKNAKYLTTTAGNVTDYDYILKDMVDMDQKAVIQKVYYDKYNATQWAIKATEERFDMEPFSQNIGNFNGATKEFERLILSGKVVIDDNPIMRYCLRNVELRMDYNGNVKPMKDVKKKKIDGVISALQALAAYQASQGIGGSNIF